ncbi:LLM class flavin-dependent oxidoreductase [Dactylosporangium sp. NPDC000555]|uniref:LLM class flavin-dependent oxidoreductase n=1 Tax=Dactylosporangium sp. NPDC000555 TaxID=3154260 RepID=UPI00331ECE2F
MTKVRLSALAGIGHTSNGTTYATSLAEQIRYLRELEAMGLLHIAGTSDAMENGMCGGLALTAEHTTHAMVGPVMATPASKNPTVAAGEIMMTNWVSGGRAFFGLGTGRGVVTASLRQYGRKPATLAELREYALAVKGLCAGEEVDYQGHRLSIWGFEPSPVPLYLDVSGPKSARLAGEIADGVVTAYGISRDAVTQLETGLAEGAAAGGRDASAVDVWHIPTTMVADTEAEAIDRLKFYLAMRINSIFKYPKEKGVPEHLLGAVAEFQREFRPAEHGKYELGYNGALLDRLGLTDWIAQRQVLAGPPGRLVERIQEVSEYGVRNIVFALWGESNEHRLRNARIIADHVLPAIS